VRSSAFFIEEVCRLPYCCNRYNLPVACIHCVGVLVVVVVVVVAAAAAAAATVVVTIIVVVVVVVTVLMLS